MLAHYPGLVDCRVEVDEVAKGVGGEGGVFSELDDRPLVEPSPKADVLDVVPAGDGVVEPQRYRPVVQGEKHRQPHLVRLGEDLLVLLHSLPVRYLPEALHRLLVDIDARDVPKHVTFHSHLNVLRRSGEYSAPVEGEPDGVVP
jgi:hypothetical protein